MNTDQPLRRHLLSLLREEHAHASFERAVKDTPVDLRGRRPEGFPHSPWELLEHLRIAQWDILEYVLNPKHESPHFPSGYWPKSPEPPNAAAWDESVNALRADAARLAALIEDESNDILAPVAFANNATYLRQALLTADHNAYHVGQLVMARRLLGGWGD